MLKQSKKLIFGCAIRRKCCNNISLFVKKYIYNIKDIIKFLGGGGMKKNIIQKMLLIFVLSIFMMGCTKQTEEEGSVYYLNFKPEVAGVWEEIAQIYTEKRELR